MLAFGVALLIAQSALGSISSFQIGVQGIDADATSAGISRSAVLAQAHQTLSEHSVPCDEQDAGPARLKPEANLSVAVFITGHPAHGALLLQVYEPVRLVTGEAQNAAIWTYLMVVSSTEGGETDFSAALDRALVPFAAAYGKARSTWLATPGPDAGASKEAPPWTDPPTAVRSNVVQPASRTASCSSTTLLAIGMNKKQVGRVLGAPYLSSMGQCGGAPHIKAWPCETVSFACVWPGTSTITKLDVVFGYDKAQSWSTNEPLPTLPE